MPIKIEDIESLVKACIDGDRKAQKLLFESYAPRLFGYIRRFVPNHHDAQDILVEAFYKILVHLNQCKDLLFFEAWMRRIAVNEALMFLRKQKTKMDFAELEANFTERIEEDVYDLESDQYIEASLDQLPKGCRAVFELFVFEQFSHQEIAEKLGISVHTSKSQLAFAKLKLKSLQAK